MCGKNLLNLHVCPPGTLGNIWWYWHILLSLCAVTNYNFFFTSLAFNPILHLTSLVLHGKMCVSTHRCTFFVVGESEKAPKLPLMEMTGNYLNRVECADNNWPKKVVFWWVLWGTSVFKKSWIRMFYGNLQHPFSTALHLFIWLLVKAAVWRRVSEF